ncbi:MAG: DNA translocase FtsK [Oscillospiraceae bacterium]|nr:DNA translocase FtsK [Oscillospiraceae bacterium]
MPATRKSPVKKPAPKRTTPSKETPAQSQAKKQMWAVVLFALGILTAALTFIEGGAFWRSIHSALFGLFGWSVYFLAPLIIYIAVIAAMDKPLSSIKAKLWQVGALIIMISGAIQIFGAGMPEAQGLIGTVAALYEGGKSLSGGGVAGAVFAAPLIGLFEKTGASIIIILAIFVFAMLITGSTLISLFRWAMAPVRTMEREYSERVKDAPAHNEKPVAPAKNTQSPGKAARFNIDVPIDGPLSTRGTPVAAGTATHGVAPPVMQDDPRSHDDGEESAAPDDQMPEHPVVSPGEDDGSIDKLIEALGQDRPTEYIHPEEFIPLGEPQPEPVVIEREHPLERDITEALGPSFDDAPPWDDDSGEPVILDILSGIAGVQGEGEIVREGIVSEAEPPPLPPEYRHPGIGLLSPAKAVSGEDVTEELKTNAEKLVDTLKSFGVQTRITDICRGPAVTRYELQPSAGVKISKITGLADDIALNLAAAGIRIEAPIPNKAAVGIEVPNKIISVVAIRDIIESREFQNAQTAVPIALGKDIAGNTVVGDIAKMPHMLIAGATGAGKSVCINSIIMSLLFKSSPDDVKLLMVDPKVVELAIYNGIPHLLIPVVTDPRKAAGALSWAVTEMLKRYKIFAENQVRDLTGYNRLAVESGELDPMPKIVIIIDELADLMMAAPNEVEDSICRLAQMARAAGMHLVIATQRPSVDVITGVIKANIPSRIAFAVSSQVDSRTILDMGGAERLLGRGDMLFYPVGASKPIRVQGCFVTDNELEKVVTFIKENENASYDEDIVEEIDRHAIAEKGKGKSTANDSGGFDGEDEMLPQAIECVVEMGQASTSSLQRRLKLGYARAARIIDQLEEKGIVGPFEGSKPRQVLISKDRWIEMKLNNAEYEQLSQSGSGSNLN